MIMMKKLVLSLALVFASAVVANVPAEVEEATRSAEELIVKQADLIDVEASN